MFVRRGPEVLVVRRSAERGGYWHSIAGGVEPGETELDAALRELREETGLDARSAVVPVGHRLMYSLDEDPPERRALFAPGTTHIEAECFVATAPAGWEPVLDFEHDEYRWCSPEEARELLYWDDVKDALARVDSGL